jgi:hypothetical protein
MSFWTENTLEPKRSFRFRVKNGSGIGIGTNEWWNVKRVDKPSYTINTNQYQLINHKINVPGIAVWNPITIEIADVGRSTNEVIRDLRTHFGYNPNNLQLDKGLGKNYSKLLESFAIEQLNGKGEVIEKWTLEGAFVSDMKLSSLDYSSDEIISITLTITYDYAILE